MSFVDMLRHIRRMRCSCGKKYFVIIKNEVMKKGIDTSATASGPLPTPEKAFMRHK